MYTTKIKSITIKIIIVTVTLNLSAQAQKTAASPVFLGGVNKTAPIAQKALDKT